MKNIIIRRFMEFFISCAVLSAAVTGMAVLKLLNSQTALLVGTFLFATVFVFVNIKQLRRCYFDLMGNVEYYASNCIAYIIFIAVNLLMCRFCPQTVFTWVFAITKFLQYLGVGITALFSAVMFHIIMLTVILVAPVGMKQIYNWRFE